MPAVLAVPDLAIRLRGGVVCEIHVLAGFLVVIISDDQNEMPAGAADRNVLHVSVSAVLIARIFDRKRDGIPRCEFQPDVAETRV